MKYLKYYIGQKVMYKDGKFFILTNNLSYQWLSYRLALIPVDKISDKMFLEIEQIVSQREGIDETDNQMLITGALITQYLIDHEVDCFDLINKELAIDKTLI